MKRWREWARVAVGGTLAWVVAVAFFGFVDGDWAFAWWLSLLATYWVTAWVLIFVLALLLAAGRWAKRSFVKPS